MPASKEELQQKAIAYIDAGLEVIPNDPKEKFPKGIPSWQTKRFTKEEMAQYIDHGYVIGVRNIEGLDFDNHGTPSAKQMITSWARVLKESYPDLLEKLLVESTPSGGFHVAWKCAVMEGNTKLASRPCTSEELEEEPDVKSYTLIETRGKGGQFMVTPSPGYKVLRGAWEQLPTITEDERLALIMSAIMLDQTPKNLHKDLATQKKTLKSDSGDSLQRPGDLYNEDPAMVAQTLPLLLEHGWQVVFEREGTYFLRRPGKTTGISATLNHVAPGIFYNFSANAAPFELNRAYYPFAVYTFLKHGGDWAQATKQLSAEAEAQGPFLDGGVEIVKVEKAPHPPLTDQQKEDFSIIKGDQLLTEKLPKENWLLHRIIPSTGFSVFAAAEGSWKTFLTLSIAQSIAGGTPWLDNPNFIVEKPTKVLFIDKENPMTIIQQRILGLGYTKEVASNIGWVKYPAKLQLTSTSKEGTKISDFMAYLSKLVQDEGFGLIVVDSLVDLLTGNENSAEDTQAFFDALRNAFADKSILLLHHENKPSQGIHRNDAQRTRGSTNINAQAAVMFRVEPMAGSQTEITIKQTKARFTQKLDKFLIKVDVEVIDEDKGETVVRGFKYMNNIEDTVSSDKSGRCEELVHEILGEYKTLSRVQLLAYATEAGISKPTVERTLKTLLADGVLSRTMDGKNARYFLSDSVKSE